MRRRRITENNGLRATESDLIERPLIEIPPKTLVFLCLAGAAISALIAWGIWAIAS